MDTVLRVGHNYYLQISWDSRAGPGNEQYPTIWIGEDGNAPIRQTRWDETGGALEGTGSCITTRAVLRTWQIRLQAGAASRRSDRLAQRRLLCIPTI